MKRREYKPGSEGSLKSQRTMGFRWPRSRTTNRPPIDVLMEKWWLVKKEAIL